MELLEVMCNRRSIRKYSGEAIPDEKLEKILQSGMLGPSSMGKRPWEFYVVKDRETLEKLAHCKQHGAAMLADCDTAIAVFADSALADAWIEDCSVSLAYMGLMASSLGIGSCWVQMRMRKDENGGDAEQNAQQIIGVGEPFRIVGILALGIPAEDKEPYSLDELKWEKVHGFCK